MNKINLLYTLLPPVYGDLEKTHKAGFLHYSFVVSGIALLIFGIFNIGWGAETLGYAMLLFVGLCVLGFILNKSKIYTPAALLLTLVIFTATYFNIVDGTGFHDPGIAALPILVILTGLLFRRRFIFVLTGISILGLILIYSLWSYDLLVLNTPPTQSRLIILSILQAVSGVLTWFAITTYHNTINTINRSEERYRDLVENQVDLIYRLELSPEQRYSYVSPSAVNITGYSPLDFYLDPEMGILLFHPDDHPTYHKLMAGEIDQETPLLLKWIKKDGSTIWVELKFTLVRGPAEGFTAVEGIARDITAQKVAEDNLLESDLRYRLILESNPDAIIILKDLRVSYCNHSVQAIFGFTPDEMIGMHPKDFSPPVQPEGLDSFQKAEEYGNQALEGKTQQFEWIHTRKNGEDFPAEVILNRILFQDEPQIMAIVRDISEREKTIEELRASEDRYRVIFNNAIEGISLHVGDIFVDVNQAWELMFGWKVADVIGKTPFDFSPERQPDGRLSKEKGWDLIHQARAGDNLKFEWRHFRSDGSEFDAEIFMTITNLSGEDVMISFVRDLTDRKRADAAAQEERHRLARELHDVVSQTLFSASLVSQTLGRNLDKDPDLLRENLADLQGLTQGALAEMRSLLFELRPSSLEYATMPDLLQQLVDGFSGRTKAQVDLKIDAAEQLPIKVRIAFFRLAQESLNNIIKHARADSVKIHYDSTKEEALLVIEDNGRGYDPNLINPGAHGLNIMNERAAEIDASLDISSQPGNGTRIELTWRSGERGK